MKQIKIEGFIDDLFSLMEPPKVSSNGGATWMKNYIAPHTVEDLYEAVLVTLRTKSTAADMKEFILPIFFPAKEDSKTGEGIVALVNSAVESTDGKIVSAKLIDKYADQMENVVVEFCTKDAIDIIKRTEQAYVDGGQNKEEISGDVYFGTILQQVISGDYDIEDEMVRLFQQFKNEAKKDEWRVDKPERSDKAASRPSAKSIDDFCKEVSSRTGGKFSKEDVMDMLSNETAMTLAADAVANVLKNMKDR